jgi:hypothetical protein
LTYFLATGIAPIARENFMTASTSAPESRRPRARPRRISYLALAFVALAVLAGSISAMLERDRSTAVPAVGTDAAAVAVAAVQDSSVPDAGDALASQRDVPPGPWIDTF